MQYKTTKFYINDYIHLNSKIASSNQANKKNTSNQQQQQQQKVKEKLRK